MQKKDLKDGMILIRRLEGLSKLMYVANRVYYINDEEVGLCQGVTLKNYNEDLTFKYDSDFDIVKIILADNVVWEREEPEEDEERIILTEQEETFLSILKDVFDKKYIYRSFSGALYISNEKPKILKSCFSKMIFDVSSEYLNNALRIGVVKKSDFLSFVKNGETYEINELLKNKEKEN